MDFFQKLIGKEVLLPLGVSLCFAGIILRGFARGSRRAIALRHQHWLHTRKPGESNPNDRQTGWFEKHLSAIANTTALAGLVITLISFLR